MWIILFVFDMSPILCFWKLEKIITHSSRICNNILKGYDHGMLSVLIAFLILRA